ncbi:MAG: LamG-like jellyroll fold domain-containing protein [Eubacterium sp.]
MKTKFVKRFISLLISLILIVTSVPMFATAAYAAEEDRFLFAYFTGNGNVASSGGVDDQAIRFAVSSDGYSYEKVNGGNQVIKQYVGTENARDPYLFKGQDGMYYCLATDADCSTGWWGNSNTMVFWRSKDLVNWKDATIINMAEITGVDVWRCWAPQVIWDGTQYMVYFALAAAGYNDGGTGNNTHMYYCTTPDLLDQSKYSKPQPLIVNSSKDSIDGDITYYNGSYYLFYKDETNATICVIKSDTINSFDAGTLVKLDAGSSVGALEGCQVFKNNNGEFIFMADRFSSNGNFAVYNLGTDLDVVFTGASVSNGVNTYSLPSQVSHNLTTSAIGPRHGSVVKITSEQYTELKSVAFSTELPADSSLSTPVQPADRNNGIDLSSSLVTQYFVNSNVTADATSKHPLTVAGNGALWSSTAFGSHGAAYFSADNYMYSASASSMLDKTNSTQGITVAFYANISGSNAADGRFFELNNIGAKGTNIWANNSPTRYISMWASGAKMETAYYRQDSDYGVDGSVITAKPSSSPTANAWHQYVVTIGGTTTTVYIDGARAYTYEFTKNSTVFDEIKNSGYLLIGAACWPDDTFTGYMRDFRIYDKAITADDAIKLYNQYSYDNSYSVAEIKQAMTDYETKMNDALSAKTVLTNMQPAYDAYVAVRKGFDAYYYGGDATVDLEKLTIALKTSTAAMTAWTQYSGNASGSADGSYSKSNLTYGDQMLNVLYTYGVGGSSGYEVADSSAQIKSFGVQYGNIVFLYDGTTMACPINACYTRPGSNYTTKRPVYLYSTTDNFSLSHFWHGSSSTDTGYQTGESDKLSHSPSISQPANNNTAVLKKTYYFSNTLYYNGTFTDNTELLRTINGVSYSGKDNVDGTINITMSSSSNNNGSVISIINYKALVDKIADAFGTLPAVTNYKQGRDSSDSFGYSEILGYFDDATSFDPNYYFSYVTTLSDNINTCIRNLSARINNLDNRVNVANADFGEENYQSLRDEIGSFINGDVRLDETVYTTDSINDYKNVYSASQSLFRYVDDDGKGYTQDACAGECANALANVLNEKLDVSGLKTELESKTIFDENGLQIYTFDSWVENVSPYANIFYELKQYSGRYETVNAVVHNSDGAVITYNAKTTVNYQDISDTAEEELSKVTLTPVDTEGYQNFDAAYTVASSVDEDMYAADKFAEFKTIVGNAYSNVYTTATAENADLYNSVTSGVGITENTQLRTSLSTADTDINTAAILTAIDSLKDYIRTLRVNISENVVNPVVTSKYFCSGEAFSVALPDNVNVSDGKAVQWVITEYATNEDMENGAEPLSSRVVTKYPDECVELIAKGAVDIQYIVDGGARTSKYIYRVYNPYGNAVEIIYSDDLISSSDLDGKIKYNPVLPFYKFVSWSVTDLGNDEFKVVPEFTI